MAKLGKRTSKAREGVDPAKAYSVDEAVKMVKDRAKAKFDETVEIAMNLGVDPRHADQMVRGVVNLPHGTGKVSRVIVFAQGAKAEEAVAAGADEVGTDELVARIQGGWLDFDAAIAKDSTSTKFDATVEVAMRLGVDPRKADQMVRGTVNLPHGTGKTARVLVFATGERAAQAEAAGAEFVGSDDLITRIQGGFLDFDAVVATPDLMGKVGRLGKVLGPRGLMPNPKTGTVTMDVAKAVEEIKGGKIEFRTDKHANLHFIIGKTSFSDTQLVQNYAAAIDEVQRLKPSSSKGRYLKKATVTTTMGPGIPVDPARVRALEEETVVD